MNRNLPARVLATLLIFPTFLTSTGGSARGDVFNMPAGLTSLEFVPIGNTGNPADAEVMSDGTAGYGSVAYPFRMGKFEVTAAQYTDFLNAVADEDTFGLYNPLMDGDYGANIKRFGTSPNYAYSVDADWANRPVNYVSLWDAMRFANWLHNGQPAGSQDDPTTEDGAYDLDGYTGDDGIGIMRKAGSKFWISAEDEWYKAAYYDPVADVYYDYATGTDATPSNVLSNPLSDPGNNANFYQGSTLTTDAPYYRTNVGDFENSASPYGTFDQSGNVWEWNEDSIDFTMFPPDRLMRSGAYGYGDYYLLSSSRANNEPPSSEEDSIGFRVAAVAVPEPRADILGLVGILLAICWRRRVTPRLQQFLLC